MPYGTPVNLNQGTTIRPYLSNLEVTNIKEINKLKIIFLLSGDYEMRTQRYVGKEPREHTSNLPIGEEAVQIAQLMDMQDARQSKESIDYPKEQLVECHWEELMEQLIVLAQDGQRSVSNRKVPKCYCQRKLSPVNRF